MFDRYQVIKNAVNYELANFIFNYFLLKQGHAIIFASFLNHRVNPVTKGMRQSLVCWFGGKPFR